ncbi:MAG: MarR family winged helix-turn-helix transcriptional regulator [Bryobacteraceae bacterium]
MTITASDAGLIEDFLGSTHIFALALTHVLEETLLRDVAAGQLTPAQMKVLKLTAQAQAPTVGDVATFLGISDAAASKAIDRLVRRNFLQRIETQADRRSSHLAVTPAGRCMLAAFETVRRRRLAEVFDQFPPEELHRTAQLLDQLAASIVSTSGKPGEICLQCGVYFKERCLLHGAASQNCQFRSRKPRQAARLSKEGQPE